MLADRGGDDLEEVWLLAFVGRYARHTERIEGHDLFAQGEHLYPFGAGCDDANDLRDGTLMRVDIQDADVLRAVNPLELLAYLRSSGWAEARNEPGRFAIWIRGTIEKPGAEIVLPLDRTVRDYARRIHEALTTLEQVEERSEIQILQDLATTSADVIRVRLEHGDQASGSIPIDHGVALIEKARELLLASACAAVNPRPTFGPKRPQRALEYLKHTRLGQTEHGSYVITLISKVTPELETMAQPVDEPFERQVTAILAQAVSAIQRASERAVVTRSLEAFREHVEDGVSANLCDAIVGMAGGPNEGRALTFDFSWARTRPLRANTDYSRVRLGSDVLPVIAEAARMFREALPQENFEIAGPVVKLERREGELNGHVTVYSTFEAPARHVRIFLDPFNYGVAVDAHAKGALVSAIGTLKREGRFWVMNEPRSFDFSDVE